VRFEVGFERNEPRDNLVYLLYASVLGLWVPCGIVPTLRLVVRLSMFKPKITYQTRKCKPATPFSSNRVGKLCTRWYV
jgi:hypothetical protein